ncbi:TetR/AcrR family transcriptional regulator [Alteribacillus bidgolensis]|uniref:Transcriptional regulator, TetR family n=1 Tax=Alteribacillus bidgolensis TaxID=930129 RepID=A0A1G8HB39_9BACI|nr:TetR/AcrR family transcriptional regulator [Alteribacillus bidgolensis]SDI03867.1 transcriptional regulator, TetR family [Alteribacillus bidgolensis]
MEITQSFINLDHDKQQRILNAALEEFAEKGFKQASTNRIVKNARIGKGMIFYYFHNKKELYKYLIDYSITFIINEYLNLIVTEETDFIERMKQAAKAKFAAQAKNPNIFNFLGTAVLTEETEIPAELQKRLQEVQELGNSKLYDNIDKSLFKKEVDADKAFQLISWSIEGYQNHLKNTLKGKKLSSINLETYWEEFYEYLDVLKTCFYEQEDGK